MKGSLIINLSFSLFFPSFLCAIDKYSKTDKNKYTNNNVILKNELSSYKINNHNYIDYSGELNNDNSPLNIIKIDNSTYFDNKIENKGKLKYIDKNKSTTNIIFNGLSNSKSENLHYTENITNFSSFANNWQKSNPYKTNSYLHNKITDNIEDKNESTVIEKDVNIGKSSTLYNIKSANTMPVTPGISNIMNNLNIKNN